MRLIDRREPVGESKVRQACRQDLERDARLESREGRTDAVMDAAPEGQVRRDASTVEGEGVASA